MVHVPATMKVGKPCKKCGGNLYYKARNQCVGCRMNKAHVQWCTNAKGWPKKVSKAEFKEKMQGVDYEST